MENPFQTNFHLFVRDNLIIPVYRRQCGDTPKATAQTIDKVSKSLPG